MADAAEHDPVGEPDNGARAQLARLGAGVALLLIAFVVFAGSHWVAGRQHHAYDPDASPLSSYRLTAGRTYQLSSGQPVARLVATGVLTTPSCIWTTDGQLTTPLVLDGILNDERNRHQFATFTAPVTGSVHITCADVPTVFVDDADDRQPDWSAALVVLSVLLGLVGTILVLSGGYELTG